MKKISLVLSLVLALSLMGLAQTKAADSKKKGGNPDAEQKLTQMEKSLWEAWKTKNFDPFKQAMAAESFNVGSSGVTGTDQMLREMPAQKCEVASYSVDQPQFMWVDKKSVVMAYHATQDATCDGKKVPAEVWASSMWTNQGGQWKAIFHQETPVTNSPQSSTP